MAHDSESEFLGFVAFAVVFPREGYQTFRQSDESDAECSLVDNGFDGLVGTQFVAAYPQFSHQQRELFCQSRFLKVETVVKLAGGDFENVVEFMEEQGDAFVLVAHRHGLYCKTHKVYG
jgi:hypothetical protein